MAADARLPTVAADAEMDGVNQGTCSSPACPADCPKRLEELPTEILFHILEFLDVDDLLAASRVS